MTASGAAVIREHAAQPPPGAPSPRRLRVLVLADSAVPVPPVGYGGTERILGYLLEGLAGRGHEVTFAGARGSRPPGRLITFSDARDRTRALRGLAKLSYWRRLRAELGSHDLIHSTLRLDYLLPALRHPIPKVLHFHTPVSDRDLRFVERHARGPVVFSAVGAHMIRDVRHRGVWRPVHNGIPVARYRFQARPVDPPYLAFLAKLMRGKGAHRAIAVARRAGMRLVIAGNRGTLPADREYFERDLAPMLQAPGVDYIGEVGDEEKARLLGGAVALLNPTEFDEAFGLTVVEALACGTPVITMSRGELPALIRPGVTGFLCDDEDAMVDAIPHAVALDRTGCRQDAERRFDVSVMLDKFEDVYRWMVNGCTEPPASWEHP